MVTVSDFSTASGATIGSTDLDTRSFALNEELNAVMDSKDVAGELDQHFADDLRILAQGRL